MLLCSPCASSSGELQVFLLFWWFCFVAIGLGFDLFCQTAEAQTNMWNRNAQHPKPSSERRRHQTVCAVRIGKLGQIQLISLVAALPNNALQPEANLSCSSVQGRHFFETDLSSAATILNPALISVSLSPSLSGDTQVSGSPDS